jgi:hypothetical protein
MDVAVDQWNCTLVTDFLFWGHLKSDVYTNHSGTNETLKGCVKERYDKSKGIFVTGHGGL